MESKESKPRQPLRLIVGLVLAVVALVLAVYFYLCIPTPGDSGEKHKEKEVMALRDSACAMIKDGHYSEGIERLDRALTLSPLNKNVLMDRAAAYFRKGNFQAALSDYQLVLEQPEEANSTANDALFGVALCQSSLGRDADCLINLKKLLARDEHFVRAYQLMGDVYLKGKNSEAAVDAYTRGLRVNAKSSVLHYDRAVAYLQRNMNEQAFEDMSMAVELDRKSLSLRVKHANLAQKLGKLNIADSDAQEILRIEPDNRTALSWLKSRKITPLIEGEIKK